jgi:hypothetical protein
MNSQDIRDMWLEEELQEVPVPEKFLPRSLRGKGLNLLVRELSAEEAGDIIDACSDKKSGKLNQKLFMSRVVLSSLRNADEPDCPLLWTDITYLQPLLKKGLNPILSIAKQSIELSGLNDQVTEDLKNDSGPIVVEGSLSA